MAEDIEKAQRIRNTVVQELKKSFKMTIRSNLSKEERQILQKIREEDSIIMCPVDKGKAIVIEDRDNYLRKQYEEINQGDYELAKGKEKSLLDRIHKKLVKQLKSMGLNHFKDRRKYLITGPLMANINLLVKVHKGIFQEDQSSVKSMTQRIICVKS